MAGGLRVIGAGLPRTGTFSLRMALERLLGGTCYHMSTLRERGNVDIPAFIDAAHGRPVDWDAVFTGCSAAVDWPPSAVWKQLAAAYPDAPILLSTRSDADAWWRSADATVWAYIRSQRDAAALDDTDAAWLTMTTAFMTATFGPGWDDEAAAKTGYDRWNADVRASAPAGRLVEWQPGDGWEPLCAALDVPVPDEPFPHRNTTEEFVARQVARAEEKRAAAEH
ncbi:MAG TPA: sulfotransferase [Mycobacteriales bacterium]|nr:sulfotransferase [Mycobacteriales bacterium]